MKITRQRLKQIIAEELRGEHVRGADQISAQIQPLEASPVKDILIHLIDKIAHLESDVERLKINQNDSSTSSVHPAESEYA